MPMSTLRFLIFNLSAMSHFPLLLFLLMVGLAGSTFGQSDFTLEMPKGYCYGNYADNYPVCYYRATLFKSMFPFCGSSRDYAVFEASRYAENGKSRKFLLYDMSENRVSAFDSCTDEVFKACFYYGFKDDTLYALRNDTVQAYQIVGQQPFGLPPASAGKSSNNLKHVRNHGVWYSFNAQGDLACCDMENDQIVLYPAEGRRLNCKTIPSAMGGKIVSWLSDSQLIYADVNVEGFGDMYYDLYLFDVGDGSRQQIAKHLGNVFDYRNGVFLYESEPRILCYGVLEHGQLKTVKNLDFTQTFGWIYGAYLLDNGNLLLVGDSRQDFNCVYCQCKIQQ